MKTSRSPFAVLAGCASASNSRRAIILSTLALLACLPNPASSQIQPNSHELHAYVGAFFGDELTDSSISGRVAKVDDDLTFGIRYGYNFTQSLGMELSLGHTAGSVTDTPTNDIDIGLTTLDFNAIFHINTASPRWVPYITVGAGYVWADLDKSIHGKVSDLDVALGGEDSVTGNAGVGLKYFVSDRLMLRFDARYRYVDKLVDRFADSLNTFETTAGVGWRF